MAAIFLLIEGGESVKSDRLWLLLSRIILLIDNVNAALCDISAQVSTSCNDACLVEKVC